MIPFWIVCYGIVVGVISFIIGAALGVTAQFVWLGVVIATALVFWRLILIHERRIDNQRMQMRKGIRL